MVRFIQTKGGAFIAGSEIASVREIDRSISSITTRNGEQHTVEESTSFIVSILEEQREVIPASPGYNAIRRVFSEKEKKWIYEIRPIIGWMRYPRAIYDQDDNYPGYPTAMRSIPIVAGSLVNEHEWNFVLPDGRVIEVFRIHASIQEWFDAQGGEGIDVKKRKKKIDPDIYDEEIIESVLETESLWPKSRKRTKKQASAG